MYNSKPAVFAYIIVMTALTCCSGNMHKINTKSAKQDYSFSVPAGWGVEKFALPPSFAPSITYNGFEDIRFAPGWAKPQSNEYWSYAFLWWADGEQHINDTTLQNQLAAYYTGLVAANTKGKVIANKLIPATAIIKQIAAAPEDAATFKGSITMQDYMDVSLAPLTLNCIVHKKKCNGHTALLFLLSPKGESDTVWDALNKLHREFSCE